MSAIIDALREEGDALHAFLEDKSPAFFRRSSAFKAWTADDVLAHLHFSDRLGVLTMRDPEAFQARMDAIMNVLMEGRSLMDETWRALGDLRGAALLSAWRETFQDMCDRLDALPDGARLKWFGPDMGVKMFASARQMETWAHGQALYDLAGVTRDEADRVRNVVVVGVKTYGWTFANRGLEPPGPLPLLRLTAPSGAIWEWGDAEAGSMIEGRAVEFAQVVAQTRNVADTDLKVAGETAERWMGIAQCFAGPPVDPPAPGTRGPAHA